MHSPPRARSQDFAGRLRTHVEGGLARGMERVWVGIEVPAFVDIAVGTQELFLLDETADGLLAVYRDPYGAGTCDTGGGRNCAYTIRMHARDGTTAWALDTGPLVSRTDQIEIQDVRYEGGTLYFNEACQSYSSGARGRCSSLVAVEPRAGRVLWRTPPLTSNNVFLVLPTYVVCGYGFTSEPDHLFVVRRTDGRVVHRTRLRSAHEALTLVEPTILEARIYPGQVVRFRLEGFEGARPRLVPIAQ